MWRSKEAEGINADPRIPESHKKAVLPDQKVNIVNARKVQEEYDDAKGMFDRYGFCLLKHPTKV